VFFLAKARRLYTKASAASSDTVDPERPTMTPVFLTSAADPRGFAADTGREVAVVGRSNSGKSSAINAMVRMRKLARVSKTPRKTQLINFFELAPGCRLVDLPGYGFAQVPEAVRARWESLITAYFAKRHSLAGLVITVDIRRGIKDLDRRMIDWAEELGLPVLVLLTKADKFSRGRALRVAQALSREVPEGVVLVVFSSTSGAGVAEARAVLREWLGMGPE